MNVALIEFNNFHDECIYSQVAMLKSKPNIKIFFICNYHLKNRIDYWDLFDDVLFIRSNQWAIGYLKIIYFLRKNNIKKCIFNSVHHPSTANLLSISSTKRKYFGTMHDRKNFSSKLSSRLNKYMDSYFVLNDYLLNNISKYHTSSIPVNSLYTIFYQQYSILPIQKEKDEVWITIPAKIQKHRRDYKTLLDCFKQKELNKNIKLIFLGQSIFMKNHGQNVRQEFEKIDKNNNCLFWDSFIDKDTFHTYMKMSDYILPLIHTNDKTIEEYQNKISGSFNLAFSYQKPMLMDKYFKNIEDFKSNSLFYNNDDNIINILNDLKPLKKEKYYIDSKWKIEYQSEKFIANTQL